MAINLVPLKVTIKLGPDSKYIYPDFNVVPAADRRNLDWHNYVDLWGGWRYDNASPIGQADAVNPDPYTTHGMFLAQPAFARAALAAFPTDVVALTAAEAAAFNDDRFLATLPAEHIVSEIVAGIRQKYGLVGRITATDLAAMDPTDRQALNPKSRRVGRISQLWADHVAMRGINVVGP